MRDIGQSLLRFSIKPLIYNDTVFQTCMFHPPFLTGTPAPADEANLRRALPKAAIPSDRRLQ
jgi:hypothetical protein